MIAAYTVETTKGVFRNERAPSLLIGESAVNGELWTISGPGGNLGAGGVPSRSNYRARPGGVTANLQDVCGIPSDGGYANEFTVRRP